MKLRLICSALLALAAASAAIADSTDAALDHANQLRQAHHLAEAQAIISPILARDPNNFRAIYDEALVQGDQGAVASAIVTLNRAINSLHGAVAPDVTIYNTLGWYLMQTGDYKDAEHWFSVAYSNRGAMKSPSLQKLLNNMGTLYALEGNRSAATRYFNEAATAGSPSANANLTKLIG